MNSIQKYIRAKKIYWNELLPINVKSRYYDLEGFQTGKSSLHSIELQKLDEVAGRSSWHPQCHFGLGTMSRARLGANVVGVDFSERAMALANSLSKELSIEAEFICSDVYKLPEKLDKKFDIVFTSHGAICWLPNLRPWTKVIGHFLKPEGSFYMVEDHPVANVFNGSEQVPMLGVESSYFHSCIPERTEKPGGYTKKKVNLRSHNFEWNRSISDVLWALIEAGLKIVFLHEFPVYAWRRFPSMTQDEDDW